MAKQGKYYVKCFKCGFIGWYSEDLIHKMPLRISWICGGSLSLKPTEEEIEEFERLEQGI